ncbi:PIN domain nuclease [Nocardioides immobilis]|uniref:Ribonuclease VapC n=1 Tax=Nocardioides immobilis TaxID=2049295 RepID=A0A417Y1N3_9ACTN|nr:PIN domain nuclease [Nocardioides immobilis]RHW26543.1 PIN domain nuclease [Nocardioides immobilis]
MVILVDTSVWVDYMRGGDGPGHRALSRLKDTAIGSIATTPPISMELLAGPTDELGVRRVERVLESVPSLALEPVHDFDAAAAIFRAVRRSGRTPRSITDCLIAAVAIRHGVPLLHRDADFDAVAEVTELDSRSLL